MSHAALDDYPRDGARARMLVALLLALALALHALRAWQVNSRQPTDFLIFYEASLDLQGGADPYRDAPTHLPYIYPPLLIWAIAPLTALPLHGAVEVWVGLSFAAWILIAALALRLARPRFGAAPLALVVLPSLLCYRFILRLNLHGQVDLVLWALVIGAAWALHARRDRLCGVLTGLALVVKPLPVLFFGWLALKRRWTALAVTVLTASGLLALPALTVGPARGAELLAQWMNGRIGRDLTDVGFEVHTSNQSLQAFLFRYTAARTSDPGEPWPAPVAALAPGEVNAAWAVLALLIVLPLPFVIGSGEPGRRRLGAEVALLVCATHLISRRTMEYHLVSLVIVHTVLCGLALSPAIARRWRLGAGAVLFTSALLTSFYAPPFVGKVASVALQGRSFTTLALLFAWGFLCFVLARWEAVLGVRGQPCYPRRLRR